MHFSYMQEHLAVAFSPSSRYHPFFSLWKQQKEYQRQEREQSERDPDNLQGREYLMEGTHRPQRLHEKPPIS